MLEITEETMTNGQSRDTGNIGHKTHNEHKQKRSTTHIRPRKKISFDCETTKRNI